MKIVSRIKLTTLLAVGLVTSVFGQSPLISSLGQNGQLEAYNLMPGTVASVEWAPSLLGPWTNSWKGLESVVVDSSGRIQVSVPMFYRVRGTPVPTLGRATFTKWVTTFPNSPGLIANMAGVVGGDVGTGTYTGEVLKMNTDAVSGVTEIVAFYHFHGPLHPFTALVHVLQNGAATGSKAVIDGVVTDGWLKGHAVEGEFTQIAIDHDGGTGYQGSLNIQNDNREPSDANATFTKWVAAFPNQPGRVLDLAGVVGGAAGVGTFTGDVLLYNPDPTISHFVAFYRFAGPQHSFTALVDVLQTGAVTGSKATIVGVITEGWMKGHAVEGEFTQIAIDHDGGTGFQGSLNIKSGTIP